MANIWLKRLIARLNLIYIIFGQFNLIKYADYCEYQGPDGATDTHKQASLKQEQDFKKIFSSKLFVGGAKLPDTGSGELKTEENASKL